MSVPKKLLDKINEDEQQGYTSDEIVAALSESQTYPDIAFKVQDHLKQGYSTSEIHEAIKSSPVENIFERGTHMVGEAVSNIGKHTGLPSVESLGEDLKKSKSYIDTMQSVYGEYADIPTQLIKGLTFNYVPAVETPAEAGVTRNILSKASYLLGMGVGVSPVAKGFQAVFPAAGIIAGAARGAATGAVYGGISKPETEYEETRLTNAAKYAIMFGAFEGVGGLIEKVATRIPEIGKVFEKIKTKQPLTPKEANIYEAVGMGRSAMLGAGAGTTEPAEDWQQRITNAVIGMGSFGLVHLATGSASRIIKNIKAGEEKLPQDSRMNIEEALLNPDTPVEKRRLAGRILLQRMSQEENSRIDVELAGRFIEDKIKEKLPIDMAEYDHYKEVAKRAATGYFQKQSSTTPIDQRSPGEKEVDIGISLRFKDRALWTAEEILIAKKLGIADEAGNPINTIMPITQKTTMTEEQVAEKARLERERELQRPIKGVLPFEGAVRAGEVDIGRLTPEEMARRIGQRIAAGEEREIPLGLEGEKIVPEVEPIKKVEPIKPEPTEVTTKKPPAIMEESSDIYVDIKKAITERPSGIMADLENQMADSQGNVVVPRGQRIAIENALEQEIQKHTGALGGKVEQVGTGKLGTSVYEIERPYGKLIYNEATGEMTPVREKLTPELMSSRETEFQLDRTMLLQTVSKDIVNNDLPGTVANETFQNSLDAFINKLEGEAKNIRVSITDNTHTDNKQETLVVIEDNGKGMSEKEVEDNLLKLGAKGKEGEISRGGYGLAKAGLLLTARRTVVITIKDGIKTILTGTKEQFFGVEGAGKPSLFTERTNELNGTKFELSFFRREEDARSENAFELAGFQIEKAFDKYITKGVLTPGINITLTNRYGETKDIVTTSPSALPQIFKKFTVSALGNKATIYFVPDENPSIFKGWDKRYSINVDTYNKGLALFGIEKGRYSLTGSIDPVNWKVIVDFDKTTDVRNRDYPFIKNRTFLNEEVKTAIQSKINERLRELNAKAFKGKKDAFAKMIKDSPIVNGIGIMIPFMDKTEFEKTKKLIKDNGDMVSDLANVFKSFQTLLDKVGEKTIRLVMTPDPGVHGYRSIPESTGHEFYAINPFVITETLESHPRWRALIDSGYDKREAMSSNMVHTLVHEFAHSKESDHNERFALELAHLYVKMSHGQLARLEREVRTFYEKHENSIRSLQNDFKGMGKRGSQFQQDELTVYSSRYFAGGESSKQRVQESLRARQETILDSVIGETLAKTKLSDILEHKKELFRAKSEEALRRYLDGESTALDAMPNVKQRVIGALIDEHAPGILDSTTKTGGSTYNLVKGNLIGTPGYSVGIDRTTNLKVTPEELRKTPGIIKDYMRKHLGKLEQEGYSVGTWLNKEINKIEFDIVRTPENIREAFALAKANKQEYIYDLITGNELPVPKVSTYDYEHYSTAKKLYALSPKSAYRGAAGAEKAYQFYKEDFDSEGVYVYPKGKVPEVPVRTRAVTKYAGTLEGAFLDKGTPEFEKIVKQAEDMIRTKYADKYGEGNTDAMNAAFQHLAQDYGYDGIRSPEGVKWFKDIPVEREFDLATGKPIFKTDISKKTFWTTSAAQPLTEFISTEVRDRGNYSEREVADWMAKYGLTKRDKVIWVSPDKATAEKYTLTAEQIEKGERPGEADRVDISEGFIIPESDDGGGGFLFALKKSKPIKLGPGAMTEAGQITEREVPADIDQLAGTLSNLKGNKTMNLDAELSLVQKAAQQLSSAKTIQAQAMTSIKGMWTVIKDRYMKPIQWTDFKDILGENLAQSTKTSLRVVSFAKQILKALPSKIQREAMYNYIEAGGDMAQMRDAVKLTTEPFRKGWEAAMRLTPQEKLFAENVKSFFDSMLQEAIDVGMMKHGVENYIMRIVKPESDVFKKFQAQVNAGLLRKDPTFIRRRIFETIVEGERLGVNYVKDVGQSIVNYSQAFYNAISARMLIRDLLKTGVASDGRPLASIIGGRLQVEQEGTPDAFIVKPRLGVGEMHRTAEGRWEAKPAVDAKGNPYLTVDHPALREWKWIGNDEAGNPVILQGDIALHPEIHSHMKNILSKSALRKSPVGRGVLALVRELKSTLLSMSGFHQVQIGIHAGFHKVAPWNLPELNLKDAIQYDLVKHGLMVYDHNALSEFTEGLAGTGLIQRLPGVGNLFHKYNNWLFADQIPRIKMKMALAALERNTERYSGKLNKDQISALTASQANAAFGELNYKMMGRNPTHQDIFRLINLAPDFLEARTRFVVQAIKPYGREQSAALIRGTLGLVLATKIINTLLDNDPHWEKPLSLVIKGKEITLRSVPGDLFHLYNDPRSFVYHRLNPTIARTMVEGVTGRDFLGRKRSFTQNVRDFVTSHIPIPIQAPFQERDRRLWESAMSSIGFATYDYRSTAETTARKLMMDRGPFQHTEHSMRVRELLTKLDKDSLTHQDIEQAVHDKEITMGDYHKILKEHAKPNIIRAIQYLPLEDIQEVWNQMTDAERKETKRLIRKKLINRWAKMLPEERAKMRPFMREMQ